MAGRMKRTQIYLEPEIDENLGRLATRRGVSKAQLLREGAVRILNEELEAGEDPIMGVVGIGRSGGGRTSEEHDEYLARRKTDRGNQ